MKTGHNIARVSAQMIRSAVKDLRIEGQTARGSNALESLDEIAKQLDQYATAFEPTSEARPQ